MSCTVVVSKKAGGGSVLPYFLAVLRPEQHSVESKILGKKSVKIKDTNTPQ